MSDSSPNVASESLSRLFAGITMTGKVLAGLLGLGYVLCIVSPASTPFLVLFPYLTLLRPWTILTAGFVEVFLFSLIFHILVALLLTQGLEHRWKVIELSKFLCITLSGTFILVFLVIAFVSLISGGALGSKMTFSGFTPAFSGILVAYKEIHGDHFSSTILGYSISMKWIPSVYVIFSLGIAFLFNFFSDFWLCLFGVYVSWVYLRFFQYKPETSLYGSRAPEFSFASFFPGFCGSGVDWLSNSCYNVASRIGVLRLYEASGGPGSGRAVDGGSSFSSHVPYSQLPNSANGGTGPQGRQLGGSVSLSERQRERGRQELNKRLAQLRQSSGATNPSSSPGQPQFLSSSSGSPPSSSTGGASALNETENNENSTSPSVSAHPSEEA